MDIIKLKSDIEEVINDTNRVCVDKNCKYDGISYIAVKQNNEVIQSPMIRILEDCQWGYCCYRYITNYYSNGKLVDYIHHYLISPEGLLCTSFNIGNLNIDLNIDINTFSGLLLYKSFKFYGIKERINEIVPIIPLIQSCKTKEEVDMMLKIKKQKPEINTREDMVQGLMEEIKRLKAQISEYEKVFEDIKALIPNK